MNHNISSELAQQLQTTIDTAVDSAGIAGATVAVINSEGTWFGASGVSNLETEKSLNPDELFKIGSISKTFTSATLLKLVEEEKLSLQDTLDQWLPDSIIRNIPDVQDISVEQLLNNTSGIANYTNQKWLADELAFQNGSEIDWSREAIINNYVATENPDFAPGESFNYSNTNYLLLGMLIEAATGNSYQEDRKSTRLNSSHQIISYAVFCLKKKKHNKISSKHGQGVHHTQDPIQRCLLHII